MKKENTMLPTENAKNLVLTIDKQLQQYGEELFQLIKGGYCSH